MKLIAPDYYRDFRCIAGACRHSCCIGWEIDIDDDSLARFKALPGEVGNIVRSRITYGEDGACFRLEENGRCPFLNAEGLCDMIIGFGEESLCQICADHPRFRNFFSDREYIGLGLCCEAAGRLILGRQEKVGFTVLEDDGAEEEMYEEELEILEALEDMTEFFQDRSIPMIERVGEILDELGLVPEINYTRWAYFLYGLERLDDKWDDELEMLKTGEEKQDMKLWELPFEQLMVYLLYRHLPAAREDGRVDERIAFCCIMWLIIRRICAAKEKLEFEDIVEVCRLFSSEIEYSDENIYKITEHLNA